MNAQDKSRGRLPAVVSKAVKRGAGATGIGLTPLDIRAGKRITLSDAVRAHVNRRMARELGKVAVLVERAAVRFADINGKRGGVDVSCHIQLVLSGLPSIVVEERAATARAAFDAAAATAERAARRVVGRADIGARPKRGKKAAPAPPAPPDQDAERPVVDTSLPGVSATDRKVGAGSTARRNLKKNLAGLTAALEDSRDTPSRKSTRRSTGRAKRDANLQQRQVRKLHSPKERARRNVGT